MQDEEIFRHFWGDDWQVARDVCNRHRTNGFFQTIEQKVNRSLAISAEPEMKELIKKHLSRPSLNLS